MKRSISIFVTGAFLMLILVPTLSAQSHKSRVAGKKVMLKQKQTMGLNLTDDQKAKMSDLKLALQKKLLPLKSDLQGKVTDLQLLKTENSPNLNRIDKLIDDIGKLRIKIQKEQVRHQLEVRKILTPEQRKRWDYRALGGPGKRLMKKNCRGRQPMF